MIPPLVDRIEVCVAGRPELEDATVIEKKRRADFLQTRTGNGVRRHLPGVYPLRPVGKESLGVRMRQHVRLEDASVP